MNVQEFLREHHAAHQVIDHPAAYSAQRMAEIVHVTGDKVAKTVLLRDGSGFCYYLAIVPASARVDLDKVRDAMGAPDLDLATEQEVAARCRDCEVGAMPPFGSQLGMETLIDESLAASDEIVFEGNTHHQAIRMRFSDYYELEHPLVVRIAAHA